MAEATEEQVGVIALRAPERYVRINVTKQAKGYVHETTVALRWEDDGLDWQTELAEMLTIADHEARLEIVDRERKDAERAVPS